MAVLVTGGAGYIGSHMVLDLLDAGRDVVILDDLSTGFAAAAAPGAQFVRGDIGDARLLEQVIRDHRVTAIMHFAAKTVVPDSVVNPAVYYETNMVKPATLLKTALSTGVGTFIYSSTAAVYGEVGLEPVRETAILNPTSPYGRAKLATEWMLRDAGAAYGLKYAILRYFNVAGADARGRAGQSTAAATHLIKAACQAALGARKSLTVFGDDYPTPDGTGVRDYIQVSDLVTAHAAALRHLEAGGDSLLLNCGYGRGVSVKQVIETVKRVSGSDFRVEHAPRRPGDAASVIADASQLRRLLDWRPAFDDLESIVGQAYEWERGLMAVG